MQEDKYNPQAFPLKGSEAVSDNAGMTLRDYFAANAMQGYISSKRESNHSDGAEAMNLARNAYHVADVMLQVREQSL